jgi:hypothetical protein
MPLSRPRIAANKHHTNYVRIRHTPQSAQNRRREASGTLSYQGSRQIAKAPPRPS